MEMDISTATITNPRFDDLDDEDYLWLRWRHRDKFEYYRRGAIWVEGARELMNFGGEHKKIFPKQEPPESCKITLPLYSWVIVRMTYR